MSTKLILEIEQDEKYEFFQKYDSLGKDQQEIWKLIVWWCKRFPNAHPKQSKIAEKAKCSREHVNRTFKKFIEFGWLALISRGLKRAKIMFVSESLLQIQISKREYFKKVEITSEITHSYSSYKRTSTETAGEIAIPHYLDKLKIPMSAKLKLSQLPESIYHETYYQCNKKADAGFKPDDQIGYFVGTAIKMAEKQGIWMDWPKYFRQMRLHAS